MRQDITTPQSTGAKATSQSAQSKQSAKPRRKRRR
jgi:hypothetical protein